MTKSQFELKTYFPIHPKKINTKLPSKHPLKQPLPETVAHRIDLWSPMGHLVLLFIESLWPGFTFHCAPRPTNKTEEVIIKNTANRGHWAILLDFSSVYVNSIGKGRMDNGLGFRKYGLFIYSVRAVLVFLFWIIGRF